MNLLLAHSFCLQEEERVHEELRAELKQAIQKIEEMESKIKTKTKKRSEPGNNNSLALPSHPFLTLCSISSTFYMAWLLIPDHWM